jgi:hypothetical protein
MVVTLSLPTVAVDPVKPAPIVIVLAEGYLRITIPEPPLPPAFALDAMLSPRIAEPPPPPRLAVPAPPTAPAPVAPVGEEPAPEGEPLCQDHEEEQLDDIDSILASLKPDEEEESELEGEPLPDEELEEGKMGRPTVGQKYGQDSHPRGRDPLGHEENMGSLTVRKQRNDKRKSPLALTKEIQSLVANIKKPIKKVLMEEVEPIGSMLDESNILDLEN